MIVLGVRLAAMETEDRRQPVGDQEVGPDRPLAVLGGDVQRPEPVVEQDAQEVDRLPRVRGVELDVGQQQPGREPVGGSAKPAAISSWSMAGCHVRSRRSFPARRRSSGTDGRARRRPARGRRSSRPASPCRSPGGSARAPCPRGRSPRRPVPGGSSSPPAPGPWRSPRDSGRSAGCSGRRRPARRPAPRRGSRRRPRGCRRRCGTTPGA